LTGEPHEMSLPCRKGARKGRDFLRFELRGHDGCQAPLNRPNVGTGDMPVEFAMEVGVPTNPELRVGVSMALGGS
jgi:hypothetical protein